MKKSELVKIIREEYKKVLTEAGKWHTRNIDANFYNFWAFLQTAQDFLGGYMDKMNANKEKAAYNDLKEGLDELRYIQKNIDNIVKSIEKELKDYNDKNKSN